MTRWMHFLHAGEEHIGTLSHGTLNVFQGGLFDNPRATGERLPVEDVTPLTPVQPGKMLALWNNFFVRARAQGLDVPPEPLYFMKPASSFLPAGGVIRRPASYPGPVVFEGELGIVIGKTCKEVSESEAPQFVFGYTCVNDVTAKELLHRDKSFTQWTRAKGFDTFGVFGPVIATDIDPSGLRVRALLDGEEKQDYPVSDMIFQPARLVSLISRDMTLDPGDIIACGTSIGVVPMASGNTIEIVIDGVGRLRNRFE